MGTESKECCGCTLQGRKGSHRFLFHPCLDRSFSSAYVETDHPRFSSILRRSLDGSCDNACIRECISHPEDDGYEYSIETCAHKLSDHLIVYVWASLLSAGVMCSAWLMYQQHADGECNLFFATHALPLYSILLRKLHTGILVMALIRKECTCELSSGTPIRNCQEAAKYFADKRTLDPEKAIQGVTGLSQVSSLLPPFRIFCFPLVCIG